MKAPAFQWYAAEYLADERVAQLSLESEAVYVRLLSYCWREGTIPSNPMQCAPLCKYADVKVIKPALTLFMRAPGQPGRLIHKRLEEEREKQQAFKDKQVINGKLGGRPRKPNDNPDESQTKGLGYSGITQTEPKKRSSTSSSISSSIPSNDGSAGESSSSAEALKVNPPKLSDDLTARLAALTDTTGEIRWNAGILVNPDYFARIAGKLIAAETDVEHYRKAALIVAEADDTHRTIKGWESWVSIYFTNQLQRGPLLVRTAGGTLPSQPTPRKDFPPPGKEQPGQVFYIAGRPGDYNMDKMAAAACLQHFPGASVVSLAFPQNPYIMQDGNVIRR